MKNNSFLPLYVTNFFGTLNDNFLKTLASFTVIEWLSDERVKSLAMGVAARALVLPYILCSPKGATIARGLGDIVKSTLEDGGYVIFYPSGHIQTEPEHEDIGTRQLAYNICREIGEAGLCSREIRAICVRTRGLWGRFGRARGVRLRPRSCRQSSRASYCGSSGRRSCRAAA